MWKTLDRKSKDDPNVGKAMTAHLLAGGHDWISRAAGGSDGISLGDPDGSMQVRLRGADGTCLPIATEQVVQGDCWKIHLPQADCEFGLRLSIRVVYATAKRLVLEPTIAIQTDLLDSHPILQLSVIGKPRVLDAPQASVGAPPIQVVQLSAKAGQVAVLLGPQDAPFTTDLTKGDKLTYNLFGEFLEKGVIRKARPWVILDRSDTGLTDQQLREYYRDLCQTPLPLTA